MRRKVESSQRKERVMHFVIDASVAELDVGAHDATLTDNGVGDFTLTFTEAFARAPYAQVTGLAADVIGYVDSPAVGSIGIKVTEADGSTAVDSDVFVTVIGWDAPDEN